MPNLSMTAPTRWGLNFLAILGIVVALKLGRLIFLPIVISLMLATVLWPAMNYFHRRWRCPRTLSSLIVTAGLVAVCVLGIMWSIWAIQELYQGLRPGLQSDVYNKLRIQVALLSPELADHLFPEDYQQSVFFQNLQEFVDTETKKVPHYMSVASWNILFILFMVVFILIEGEMLIRRTAEIFGSGDDPDFRAAREALGEMARHINSYLVWRTVINLGMAIMLGVIYQWLGLKQAWTWAILAGILTFVPYIGPIVAGLPAIIDAFVSVGPGAAAVVIVLYLIILTLEGYVVFPLVIGRNMEMNATTVMLACLFWWFVWDEIGLFLALPLMAGLKAICQYVPGWRPWANLMSMEPLDEKSSTAVENVVIPANPETLIELKLMEQYQNDRTKNPSGNSGDAENRGSEKPGERK